VALNYGELTMWVITIIIIVAIVVFLNYNKDKKELHTTIAQKGGMDKIFLDFISCIEDDFPNHKILVNTETELEISATSSDNKTFVFGIKLGFGGKVNYRCDTKRSNFLNADILVEGNKSNQVEPYMMMMDELRKKYSFITKDDYNDDVLEQSQSSRIDSLLDSSTPFTPTTERSEILIPTNPNKKSHLTVENKPIRMVSITNKEFIIVQEDFTERKFDVLGIQISEDSGNTFEAVPRNIDQALHHLMVFSTDRTEVDSDSYILYLDCSDNLRCELLFFLDGFPNQFAVIDQNKITIFSVRENIDHLRSKIRRGDD